MSDPQNSQNDPSQDEEHRRRAAQQRLDVSGSFETAQNPDAFFQSAIDLTNQSGPAQPTAFTRTEGAPGAHSSVPSQSGVIPQSVAVPGAGEAEIPVWDQRVVEEQKRRAAAAAAAQAAAPPPPPLNSPVGPDMNGPAPSGPDMSGPATSGTAGGVDYGQNTAQSGPRAAMSDFFDEANRTANRQGPAQPSTPQAMAGVPQEPAPPGYSFESFMNPAQQAQDPRRVPGGFFDPNETVAPNTASGAQGDARVGGAGGAPQTGTFQPNASMQYGGANAQQAFFSDGQVPAPSAPQQPQERSASFDTFQQSASSPQQNYNGAPPSNAPQPNSQHFDSAGAPPSSTPQPHTGSGAPPNSSPGEQFPGHAATASQYYAPGVNQEVSEETLAERAQRQYDEYLEQMARQAAAPQQFYDPHEKAYQDSANTDRLAAEAIAQAAALSDGLGEDVMRRAEINALPDVFLNLPKQRKKPAPSNEPPKRTRRVQPPPEAFYDEDDEDERFDRDDKFSRFERLVTPETKGVVMFTAHQVKEILTQPELFFKKMPQNGNLAEPALFFFIVVAASGLLAGVLNFNLLVSIQFILGNLLQTYALAFVVWKLCTGLGSAESYEANFRVIAYSQAALVIAGLQFSLLGNHIPGYIALLISSIMAIRLQLIGLKYVHDLSQGKLMLITILPTILILIIRSKIFLLI